MKKSLLHILCLFIGCTTFAQINEIGVFGGGMNYVGDIGSSKFIVPNQPAFGLIYKYNRSKRHSYRATAIIGSISGNDANSNESARQLRGLSFKNSIKELSVGMEFNYLNFDLHKDGFVYTPYIYTGISFFSYDEQFFLGKELKTDYTSSGFGIPMLLGIKARLNNQLNIAAEFGARYTFTDNLDGSNPKNDNLAPLRFYNKDSNDWFFVSGITLTYTFGENPCYCK
jgi:Domain of unknown function (DUF6089)